jgi:hypothetical protein
MNKEERMILLNKIGDALYEEFHAYRQPLSSTQIMCSVYTVLDRIGKEEI